MISLGARFGGALTKNMRMILADQAPHDANLERFAGLANQLPQPLRHLTAQHPVTVPVTQTK